MIHDLDAAWEELLEATPAPAGGPMKVKGRPAPPSAPPEKLREALELYGQAVTKVIAYGQRGEPLPKALVSQLMSLDATLRNLTEAAPQGRASIPPKPKAPPAPKLPRPFTAPLAEVAILSGALKFDPTRLYEEFGRERVLARLAGLRPEERPETATEFRMLLLREGGQ